MHVGNGAHLHQLQVAALALISWDCRIWVQVLKDFQARNYTGDVFHPTDRRLQQAQTLCELSASKNPERMRQAPNAETFLH
jgi:hypothetical protein